MKLYATTTSERASKGQGGNDYLRVQLTVGNSKEQANAGVVEIIESSPSKFSVKYHLNGKTKLLQEINTRGTVFEVVKGEKQKGECVHCKAIQQVSPRNCFRHE